MDVKVCSDAKLDLSKSCLLNEIPNLSLNKTVTVNGVGIFDDDGKILPIISEYLSYQSKHQIIAYESAVTYGRNLTYFLNYIRSRPDYDDNESDEVFITVPKYVIQEYLTFLIREDHKSSST
ncbi:MAG: integrase, partial [Psychrobacter sp.]|nr:integrase [Psychrobacter sp.]